MLADFYQLGEEIGEIVDCGGVEELYGILAETNSQSQDGEEKDFENAKSLEVLNTHEKFSLEEMKECHRLESEKLENGDFMTLKQRRGLRTRTEKEDTVKAQSERRRYVKRTKILTDSEKVARKRYTRRVSTELDKSNGTSSSSIAPTPHIKSVSSSSSSPILEMEIDEINTNITDIQNNSNSSTQTDGHESTENKNTIELHNLDDESSDSASDSESEIISKSKDSGILGRDSRKFELIENDNKECVKDSTKVDIKGEGDISSSLLECKEARDENGIEEKEKMKTENKVKNGIEISPEKSTQHLPNSASKIELIHDNGGAKQRVIDNVVNRSATEERMEVQEKLEVEVENEVVNEVLNEVVSRSPGLVYWTERGADDNTVAASNSSTAVIDDVDSIDDGEALTDIISDEITILEDEELTEVTDVKEGGLEVPKNGKKINVLNDLELGPESTVTPFISISSSSSLNTISSNASTSDVAVLINDGNYRDVANGSDSDDSKDVRKKGTGRKRGNEKGREKENSEKNGKGKGSGKGDETSGVNGNGRVRRARRLRKENEVVDLTCDDDDNEAEYEGDENKKVNDKKENEEEEEGKEEEKKVEKERNSPPSRKVSPQQGEDNDEKNKNDDDLLKFGTESSNESKIKNNGTVCDVSQDQSHGNGETKKIGDDLHENKKEIRNENEIGVKRKSEVDNCGDKNEISPSSNAEKRSDVNEEVMTDDVPIEVSPVIKSTRESQFLGKVENEKKSISDVCENTDQLELEVEVEVENDSMNVEDDITYIDTDSNDDSAIVLENVTGMVVNMENESKDEVVPTNVQDVQMDAQIDEDKDIEIIIPHKNEEKIQEMKVSDKNIDEDGIKNNKDDRRTDEKICEKKGERKNEEKGEMKNEKESSAKNRDNSEDTKTIIDCSINTELPSNTSESQNEGKNEIDDVDEEETGVIVINCIQLKQKIEKNASENVSESKDDDDDDDDIVIKRKSRAHYTEFNTLNNSEPDLNFGNPDVRKSSRLITVEKEASKLFKKSNAGNLKRKIDSLKENKGSRLDSIDDESEESEESDDDFESEEDDPTPHKRIRKNSLDTKDALSKKSRSQNTENKKRKKEVKVFEIDGDDDDSCDIDLRDSEDEEDVEVEEELNETEKAIRAQWNNSAANFFSPRSKSDNSASRKSSMKKPIVISEETRMGATDRKRLERDKKAFKSYESTNGKLMKFIFYYFVVCTFAA